MAELTVLGEAVSLAPSLAEAVLSVKDLNVRSGKVTILRDVTFRVADRSVLALIGPSGAGKSTLLKCLNRLVNLEPELVVNGEVRYRGESIYGCSWRPDDLRTRIGMLFQQPVIFPGSILHNVLFGVRHLKTAPRPDFPSLAEQSLRDVSLWDEVKDRLNKPANRLSVGQQQRLCLARTLATQPDVLLMDEPTSALDPRSTEAVESLILKLKQRHTIVLVTHNIGQARRVADSVACICVQNGAGEMLESGSSDLVLDHPTCQAVAEYLQHSAT